MEKDNPHKPKRLKNIDSVSISLFLKGLSWPLVFLCLLGFVYGYAIAGIFGALMGVIIGAIVSVFASLSAMFITNKFGGLFAFIYKGRKANWSTEEQLEGDLDQVRYHKMNKRFDLALIKVDEVLTRAPSHADALYLKAHILWEGFNKPIEAKRHLATILKTTSKTDNHYIWASTLYSNIIEEEKRRLNGGRERKN